MSARRISEPKGFQRVTAEAALKTLTSKNGPRRFLVADEVGLGKTVVARTIVARLLKGRRRPLVVFYVSSNLNIAHQNRGKLLELLATEKERDAASAHADRLTLAANSNNRPTHDHLHLYTLTPATSVPLYRRRGGFGRMEERALIFRLLRGRFPTLDTDDFSRTCRGNRVGASSWKWALQDHEQLHGIRALQAAFLDEFGKLVSLSRIDADSLLSAGKTARPSQFLGRLRTALALAVLRKLRPDLVIFDEFQKFRELLIDVPGVKPDPVALALRGNISSFRHPVLLLSATPYRFYSSRQDEAARLSHHREFFELLRFLFGSETDEPRQIEQAFRDFGEMMLAKETPDFQQLSNLRDDIQRRLSAVLSRTERPDGSGMGLNVPTAYPMSKLRTEDLRVFKNWVGRLREGQIRQRAKIDLMSFAVPYWLSVPLPIQMLGAGYIAWRRAENKNRRRNEPALRRSQRDRLQAPKLWPHPQFRALNDIISPSRLALPWVAPSLPWWTLQEPWSQPGATTGKLLVFTRFKATPPALASLLSFNLEVSFAHELHGNYRRAGDAQPLQFKADRPSLPALFFPSPTLIAFTDPRRDKPSTLADTRISMRRQVGLLVRERFKLKVSRLGGRRPLWKLLSALEHIREKILPDSGLPSCRDLHDHWMEVARGQAAAMAHVLKQWDASATAGLEYVTQSEVAALAEFALAGPGIALGRALYRFDANCMTGENYEDLLRASWNGLRQYLNRALFQAVLTRREQAYTKGILEAVVAGNLESVLDEHLWIASKLDADALVKFPQDLLQVLGLHEGRHRLHEPGAGDNGFLLRCHAAMPFADAKIENPATGGEDRLRTDDIRRAFNSPFWPHVLATTSLGQEGLDFHVWCRQVLHWDLCPSPIDLEQREGRIQRFGGLSVRSALADRLAKQALLNGDKSTSPWMVLAQHAEEAACDDSSGLSPWWCCPGEKIDRLFAPLPQSRLKARFAELSRLRWLYRLALGQPHQQDFLERISESEDDGRYQFALCLSAWAQNRPSLSSIQK